MPALEITPEMIGPNRTRLDLAYIEGIMLWPDDEAQRAEAIKTGRATFIRDAINAVPSAKRDVVAAAWFDWADLLTDAFPLKHIQQKAKQPFVNGIIIGELLAATIAEHVNRGAVKLEALKTELCVHLTQRATLHREFRMKRASVDALWARYKPVSHLWAAYLFNARDGTHTFPCPLGKLPDFLGVSECFRRLGCRTPLSRRRETLLSAEHLWIPPDGLPLPSYAIIPGKGRDLYLRDCSKRG